MMNATKMTKLNTFLYDDDDFKKENDINTFLLYENANLVSSINIFAPTRKEAEIIGLTLPDKRNKGYFNLLLNCAKEEINSRNIESILFTCDSKSNSGIDVVSHLKTSYEYSEFLMEYKESESRGFEYRKDITLRLAELSEKNRLVEINHQAFSNKKSESQEIIEEFYTSSKRMLYSIMLNDETIGMIGVYAETRRKYIYGFCIDTKYQKKGIGTYILNEIVQEQKKDNKKIVLEVQVDNRNALKVYENVGFIIDAEFKYYREITT